MIAAKLEDAQFGEACAARIAKALAWVAATDMHALEPGRHDIDGDALFVNCMSVTTSLPASKSFEAHHRYLDIHYVIEGEELIGVAPVGAVAAGFGAEGVGAVPVLLTGVVLTVVALAVGRPWTLTTR